jgi:hypothetical protein
MSVLKIAFLLLTIATLIFFVSAWFLGDALQSIWFLNWVSLSNLNATMTPELKAFFSLAIITIIAVIIIF